MVKAKRASANDKLSREKKLGEFLKNARLKAGLSQGDVSKILGFETPQLISNWENGRAGPPLKHIEKLCRILVIDPDKFFDFLVDYSKAVAEARTVRGLQKLSLYRKLS